MELVPEIIDEVAVLNLKPQENKRYDDKSGSDVGVAVHNWLISSELNYVIIDLQDEKDIPTAFMVELIQLHKRLKIPFLFVGVMKKAQGILDDYNFMINDYPVFFAPEDAVGYLREQYPDVSHSSLSLIKVGEALQVSRPRHLYKNGFESEEEGTEEEV